MGPLRWGIVGCGNISGTYVTALSTAPQDHLLTCVGASSLGRAEEFKAKHGLSAAAVGSYAEVFARKDVDVLYVGNQNHQHHATVLEAVKAGKAILCEKPLGVNEAEVREMTAAAKANGVFLMEVLLLQGFWSRTFPVYRRLKEELAAGSIGKPLVVTSSFGFGFGDGLLRPEICGSTMLYLGCYVVQYAVLVFGHGPVKVLSAHADKTHQGIDRHIVFTLEWPCGGQATLTASTKVTLENDAAVYGTKGKLRFPGHMWCPNKLELPSGEVVEVPLSPGPTKSADKEDFGHRIGFLYEADAVKDALAKGLTEAPEVTHEDSLAVVRILDQVRKEIGLKFPSEL